MSIITTTASISGGGGGGTNPSIVAVPRNVFQQPFGINSIWNTPLGVGTGGLVSGGTGSHGGATFKYANNDGPVYEYGGSHTVANSTCDENLLLLGPNSTSRPLYGNTIDWSVSPAAPARCSATQTAIGISLPIPSTASYPGVNGGDPCTVVGVMGSTPNCSAAVLKSDRRTFYQTQPMQICTVGATTTGSLTSTISPSYMAAINNVDIFADEVNLFTGTKPSALGSHGGSFMSALGGTIRYNEILPGNCPYLPGVADVMRHALGVSFNGLFSAFGTRSWPAINNDAGNEGFLVALLPTFNISGLLTAQGKSFAWTAMNYGMYLVDDSGWDAFTYSPEYSYGDGSVNCPTGRTACQFQTVWGTTMQPIGLTSTSFGQDLQTICLNLYVITNSTSSTIGGPGASRLQPLAVAAVDPGVISSSPSVTSNTWYLSHIGLAAGQFAAQATATNSPYYWTLTGTGATNFWIQPTTGLIYVSATGVSGIAPGTYTLTATANNIIGSNSGTITIVVS